MRTLWKGFLTFGMVTVPVDFLTATESRDLSFRSLHKDCGTPIQRRWYCPQHGDMVPDEALQKAYPITKTEFIPLSEEELAKLPNDGNRVISIQRFVSLEEIDPIFFEKTYYLAPQKEGRKPFRLLNKALKDRNKVGLGTVVLRDKEHIIAIRPYRDALAISTLYYTDEVRSLEGMDLGESLSVSDQEMNMGRALIDALSGDPDLQQFKDQYREKVLEIVKAKAEGRTFELPPVQQAPSSTMDLAKALEASLKAAQAAK